MLLFARCTALESRLVFSLQTAGMSPNMVIAGSFSVSWQCLTTVSTASALATSPWASPPMPSERTYRFIGSTIRKQSSLFVRTRPTFVTPPLTISTEAPLALLRATSTPCPHPCPGNLTPTLADPASLRKPLNPTNYSRLRHTTSRGSPRHHAHFVVGAQ